MVRFEIDSRDRLRVGQQLTSPSVYLDHWAIRYFSEHAEVSDRLVGVLKDRSGTLAISWTSIAEFARVTSKTEQLLAEELVERILPNVFFIETNPFAVADRELDFRHGVSAMAPQADQQFLQAFIEQSPNGLAPFTTKNLFTALYEANETQHLSNLAEAIVERVEALRTEANNDDISHNNLRRTSEHFPAAPDSIAVFRELARRFLVEQNIEMTQNHAIDLLHSTVPVEYCDFVLLDGYWVDAVDRLRRRFRQAHIEIRLAETYSMRKNGIPNFLDRLEGTETGI